MSKIWFCRTCGYEVASRGRCHSCKGHLERSPLRELARLDEEEEVGYDLDDWDGGARGQLIVGLIEAGVEHRFEGEELVVAVDDEARADDLVAAITAGAVVGEPDDRAVPSGGTEDGPDADDGADELVEEQLRQEVARLGAAAQRLRSDPTDMQADADVAQASAAVFAAEDFAALDPETWAAIGRVTRRLLAALGADEALDDEIRKQAGILAALLAGVTSPASPAPAGGTTSRGVTPPGEEGSAGGTEAGDTTGPGGDATGAAGDPAQGDGLVDAGESGIGEGEAVYELPEWLPEQRAELGLVLEAEGVPHRWVSGELVLPESQEARAEALFDLVEGVETPEDDEARYRSLEDLFAATTRFVGDPASASKAAAVVAAVGAADGPTPLGLDDAQWWSIRTRARTLADALEHGGSPEVAFAEASTLRDLLRELV